MKFRKDHHGGLHLSEYLLAGIFRLTLIMQQVSLLILVIQAQLFYSAADTVTWQSIHILVQTGPDGANFNPWFWCIQSNKHFTKSYLTELNIGDATGVLISPS